MCAFRCFISRPQNLHLRSRIKLAENYFFLENYVTSSEGAVTHNVLYYQPLTIIRYQVRFYVNNYFEKCCPLPLKEFVLLLLLLLLMLLLLQKQQSHCTWSTGFPASAVFTVFVLVQGILSMCFVFHNGMENTRFTFSYLNKSYLNQTRMSFYKTYFEKK